LKQIKKRKNNLPLKKTAKMQKKVPIKNINFSHKMISKIRGTTPSFYIFITPFKKRKKE